MIQIKEKLKVNAEDFFRQLSESVVYDASEAVGRKVVLEELHEGYRYQKMIKNKIGMAGNVEVHILSWKPPYHYEVEFLSSNGINRLRYEVEEDVEAGIWVSYMENFEGNSKTLDLNFKIMSIFMNRSTKKRAKYLLHAMEEHLLERNKK